MQNRDKQKMYDKTEHIQNQQLTKALKHAFGTDNIIHVWTDVAGSSFVFDAAIHLQDAVNLATTCLIKVIFAKGLTLSPSNNSALLNDLKESYLVLRRRFVFHE